MVTYTRELRSMPLWLLREYMEELGGRALTGTQVTGDGWQADLEQMEDFCIGSLRVGQVRLTWTGSEQALRNTWPKLEQKLARAGG